MAEISVGSATRASSLLDAQASRILAQARGEIRGGSSTENNERKNAKIEKSAHDFESILLGSWLQGAEQSFATVPGGDDEGDDEDAGKDQFQGIAMQALAGSMTASGGIGIAKMIAAHLRHASDSEATPAAMAGASAAAEPVSEKR